MRLEFCYDQKTAYGFERHGDCLLSPNASAIEQFLSHWVAFVDDRHFAHVQPNVDWGQMSEELPQLLSPYCEIYVSEQLRKAAKPKQLSMNIGVRVENQLLTLDFDLDGMEMSELQNVLMNSAQPCRYIWWNSEKSSSLISSSPELFNLSNSPQTSPSSSAS